jgi:predicted Zn-dependent peptidase
MVGLARAGTLSAAVEAQMLDVPVETFTLKNGLKVVVHEDHGRARRGQLRGKSCR